MIHHRLCEGVSKQSSHGVILKVADGPVVMKASFGREDRENQKFLVQFSISDAKPAEPPGIRIVMDHLIHVIFGIMSHAVWSFKCQANSY